MRFPHDWYSSADDGRVFAWGRQSIVDKTDAGFLAFVAEGETPSDWPRDLSGAQTNAALQDVLTPHGIWVDLRAYAASVRYTREIGGIKVGVSSVDTSRESQAMIANANQFMQVSGSASTQYKTNSGWVTVSADQMKAIALAVGAHVQACFTAEADIDAKIAAGTVTTTLQVDEAFAALTV